jgi:hypothetical protein
VTNPFLAQHVVAELWADIGGPIAPVSIRDQMIRGEKLAEAAAELGVIGRNRPLLVIGGGAAGVTAALAAHQRGVPTLLVESQAALFSRQSQCTTRWIDPAQYDWPHGWHKTGSYPVGPPPTFTHPSPAAIPPKPPLPWTANFAKQVATSWSQMVSGPTIACGWTLGKAHPLLVGPLARPLLQVELQNGAAIARVTVGFVVACVGFGSERTRPRSGQVRGPAFWGNDNLQDPTKVRRVLIAGAGDGALQDFIRAATRQKSALDVLNMLPKSVLTDRKVATALGELLSAEDHTARALAWNPSNGRSDPPLLRDLHKIHENALNAFWRVVNSSRLQELMPLIKLSAKIILLSKEDYFSQCYGLNRFLVLLLLELDRRLNRQKQFEWVRNAELIEIRDQHGNSPDVVANDPGPWEGYVYLPTRAMCYQNLDTVIVRYGIVPPTRGSWQSSLISRHVLPYRPW